MYTDTGKSDWANSRKYHLISLTSSSVKKNFEPFQHQKVIHMMTRNAPLDHVQWADRLSA